MEWLFTRSLIRIVHLLLHFEFRSHACLDLTSCGSHQVLQIFGGCLISLHNLFKCNTSALKPTIPYCIWSRILAFIQTDVPSEDLLHNSVTNRCHQWHKGIVARSLNAWCWDAAIMDVSILAEISSCRLLFFSNHWKVFFCVFLQWCQNYFPQWLWIMSKNEGFRT